jgi:hypothetical protein
LVGIKVVGGRKPNAAWELTDRSFVSIRPSIQLSDSDTHLNLEICFDSGMDPPSFSLKLEICFGPTIVQKV